MAETPFETENALSKERVTARRLLRQLFDDLVGKEAGIERYDTFYPVRLDDLARIREYEVKYLPLIVLDAAGTLGKIEPDKKLITIATEDPSYHDGIADPGHVSKERQRYTLAHELAHAVHHAQENAVRVCAFRSTRRAPEERERRKEVEANRVAAELLMPPKAVAHFVRQIFGEEREQILASSSYARGKWKRNSRSAIALPLSADELAAQVARYRATDGSKTLAECFGVSSEAMARRLRELNIVID
jgi:hypothetical protein